MAKARTGSPIDLLILGLIKEVPRNAYDLAVFIESRHLNLVLKVSTPAIYKNCKKLHQNGYLSGKKEKRGESPERLVYTVTKKGGVYFQDLMKELSGDILPFYFEHNSFLWHIEKLPLKEQKERVEILSESICTLQTWVSNHEQEVKKMGFFGGWILALQYKFVVDSLVKWIEAVQEELKKKK